MTAEVEFLDDLDHRLSRIEKRVRDLRCMAAEPSPASDIVMEVCAVSAALERIADRLVAEHVGRWLKDAVSTDACEGFRENDIEELLKVFHHFYG